MLPIIGLATAALFLANCFRQKENELPPPPFGVDIDKNSKTFQIYQQLKKAGVNDSEIDQGCHVIDYNRSASHETVMGQEDRKISECEVIEYALDHYEKYRQIVEGMTGKPIPWELDDFDPTTEFDAMVRAKVTTAIFTLQKLLISQNVLPGTEKYQEKLAVALFYFTDFPDDKEFIDNNRPHLLKRTEELQQIGLQGFQDILFEKGGLGTLLMVEDAPLEATAIEALRNKKGWCTEKSKILFAVYKMAGLKPFFAHLKVRDIANKLKEEGIDIPPSLIRLGHVYLGVSLEGQTRYFDLALFNPHADYPIFQPLRLRHYLGQDKSNIGVDLAKKQGKFEEAARVQREATQISPEDPFSHYNLGHALLKQGKLDEAMLAYKKATQLDPKMSDAFVSMGAVLNEQKKFDEAIAILLKEKELSPEAADISINLGKAYLGQKKLNEAAKAFLEARELDPKYLTAYHGLGMTFIQQDKLKEARIIALQATALKPQDNNNLFLARDIIYGFQNKNDWREAARTVWNLIHFNPENAGAYLLSFFVKFTPDKMDELKTILKEPIQHPDDSMAYMILLIALKRAGRSKESEEVLKEIKRIDLKYEKNEFKRIVDGVAEVVRNLEEIDKEKKKKSTSPQ
jgi:tetratricopeptide (TPR) repeat protein